MLRQKKRVLPFRRSLAVLLTMTTLWGVAATAQGATVPPVGVWDTKEDFEGNGSTIGTPTTRTNIDTASEPGFFKIGVTRDFLTTATISCATPNRIYTTGVDRTSIVVLDTAAKQKIATIPLSTKVAGVVYDSHDGKIYVGHYDDNHVTIIDDNYPEMPTATRPPLTSGSTGGAYAALYKYHSGDQTENKVYIANLADQTVSIFDATTDTLLATKPVVAGATTAAFDAVTNKVYLTSKHNQFVTVLDSNNNIEDLQVTEVINQLGGPDGVGLRADGKKAASNTRVTWTCDAPAPNDKVEFQMRSSADSGGLDTAPYQGPGASTTDWFSAPCNGSESVMDLNLPVQRFAEIQVKLSSDGLSTPKVDKLKLEYLWYPDFVLDPLTGPATAVMGSTINVDATVSNNGDGEAPESKIGFYLYQGDSVVKSFPQGDVPGLQPQTSAPARSYPITIDTNVPAGDYTLTACANPDNVIFEQHYDAANCKSYPIAIIPSQPDLLIPQASASISEGKLSYSITVKNRGNTAAGSFTTTLYLSSDTTIDGSDYYMKNVPLSGLAAHTDTVLTGTIDLPSTIPNGTYYLGAIADPANNVTEYDENNNVGISGPMGLCNDLTVTALSGSVAAGKFTYSVTIKNIGNGFAYPTPYGNIPVYLYLSSDTTVTSADYRIVSLVTPLYSGLKGGAEVKLTGTVDIPGINIPSGDYYVGAIVDPGDSVKECNESNNAVSTPDTISVTNDLEVTAVSGSVTAGKFTYTVTIKNNGNGYVYPANFGNIPINLYLSSDNAITSADYRIVALLTPLYAGLRGGASTTLTGTVDIPGMNIPSGDYYVGAIVDPSDLVKESIESNNALSTVDTISVTNDLEVTTVSGSVADGKFTYTVTIKNNGNGYVYPANFGNIPINLYLSSDNAITSADYRIVALLTPLYAGLRGGASTTLTGTVDIPGMNIPSGDYYVGAIVDPSDLVKESTESNNTLSTVDTISVTNDLEVTAVSGSVAAGKFTYTVTIKNNGNGYVYPANFGNIPINLYLSSDNTITSADYRIVALLTPLYAGLRGGASTTLTGTVDIPGMNIPSGDYYVGAIVDPSDLVKESTESNNTLSTPTPIPVFNDLVVTYVNGVVNGSNIDYEVTIKNNGNGYAYPASFGVIQVNLYLSADSNITTSDYLMKALQTALYSGLRGGSETTLRGSAPLPTQIPLGDYYVGGYIDYPNYVVESVENNNTLAGNQVPLR
ncbi:CARDB domain-containing protein [Geomonas propionica]|uniref:CARDB domain-containing protein n=1 Tax=Geomonas propionica TaxID=2798582 RepID=A0ABS0YWR3_9BACT|nr:CARDB domain-containing protein [Geomonas propionica]MBJ6802393.1 hypothetical protein [Geomonas propionica]